MAVEEQTSPLAVEDGAVKLSDDETDVEEGEAAKAVKTPAEDKAVENSIKEEALWFNDSMLFLILKYKAEF